MNFANCLDHIKNQSHTKKIPESVLVTVKRNLYNNERATNRKVYHILSKNKMYKYYENISRIVYLVNLKKID